VTFEGIAASPGIGVGPILRYVPENLAVRDDALPDDAVAAELARFESAVEASRADLVSIRNRIARELSDAEAAIYDAHLMILDDPELQSAVERGIRHGHQHAGFAFRGYMSHVAAHLEKIEDEYLREKRADVQDVERRVLRHLVGGGPRTLDAIERPCVIVAHDLPPSDVALLDRTRVLGFVTEVGSRTSHCAIVARGRGIPAVVSVRGVLQQVKSGELGAVDGFRGRFELNPGDVEHAYYVGERQRVEDENVRLAGVRHLPATTPDGHTIELGANIEQPGETDEVRAMGADGVGLFRTEFFYLNRLELPSEEEQYQAYRRVTEELAPLPVIFRTMDLGGDKVASYLGMTHETNPFLGWRGIRFALQHPDVFRTQLRALYRASAHGRMRVMFPMISNEAELRRARELCAAARAELDASGQAYDAHLELGIMIETPSAVWMADALAREAQFFSIGTNDLTQYTLAMDRDNPRLAHLYEPLEPAVLRSIAHTIRAAQAARRWVGVCGEMAGDPRTAILLMGLGVQELSMATYDLPRVKFAIRTVPMSEARAVAEEALVQSSVDAVKRLLAERIDPAIEAAYAGARSRS
jgi:phosphotransferase system enzyme I (PtsI)